MKIATLSLVFTLLGCLSTLRADDNPMNAADSAMRQHNWPKAIGIFKTIVATDTGNLRAWYNLGYSYKNQEEFDSALQCFVHVQKSKPDFAGTYLSLAEIYSHKKQFADAVKAYDDFLKRDTTKPVAHFNRLACLISMDHRKDAYQEAKLCKSLPLGEGLEQKVDEILASLGDRNPTSAAKTFMDDHQIVSLSMPSGWTMKQVDDNKTMQMFISAEKIVRDNDLYTLGCTVTFIRRISKSIPSLKGKKDNELATYWLAVSDTGGMGMLGYENYYWHRIIAEENVVLNGIQFRKVIRELQLLDDSPAEKSDNEESNSNATGSLESNEDASMNKNQASTKELLMQAAFYRSVHQASGATDKGSMAELYEKLAKQQTNQNAEMDSDINKTSISASIQKKNNKTKITLFSSAKLCIQLVAALKDNVCTVVYEAPADEFDAYLPVFNASMQSLKVNMSSK